MTLPFQLTKKIHRSVPDMLLSEKQENSQKGKIIVITGGGTGIGAAAARIWVRAGAEGVVIVGRRKEPVEQTARSLEELGKGATKILAVPADLKVEKEVEDVFRQVNETFGRPADVVLANAGLVDPPRPLAEEATSTWWSAYEVHVLGLHHTVTAWIRSQPDPTKLIGTVISTNSGLAGMVYPGNSAYGSWKLAAQRYMEFVQTDYPSLRAFTLLPGIVDTEVLDRDFEAYAKDEAEQTGTFTLYLASARAELLQGLADEHQLGSARDGSS